MSAVVKPLPKKPTPAAVIELITPTLAQQYLETMTRNRPLSESRIVEYAIAMEADQWVVNGDTLKFDEEGKLFDGQHRLHACILAGKPFRSYVVRMVADPRAMATVDTGKGRTHTDVWTISGHQNAAAASVIANLVYFYERKRIGWRGFGGRRIDRSSEIGKKLKALPTAASKLSKAELLKFAEPIMEGLQDSARFAHTCPAKRLVHHSVVGAIHYLAVKKGHRACVEDFLNDVGAGAGLERGDPAHTVREHIILRTKNGAKLHRNYVIGALIKALNARIDGAAMKIVRVQPDEEFPRIK